MIISLPAPLLLALSALELGILFLAAYIWFRQRGLTPAGAGAYAVVSSQMWLSFLFQFFFYLGRPALSLLPETMATVWGLVFLVRQRRLPWLDLTTSAGRIRNHPLTALGLAVILGYLILSAVLLPPSVTQWGDLVQVLTFISRQSLFSGAHPLPALNHLILANLFLRWGTDFGLGLLGLSSYLAMGLTTYTLARRFSWPPTALVVTLVVLSMPRLLLQASTSTPEIMAGATACFCLLAAFRAVEQPRLFDLLLLVLGIFFSISGPAMPLAFPAIMAALAAILLFRRHGARSWLALVKRRWKLSVLALPPILIFSQAWVFHFNQVHFHDWPVPAELNSNLANQDGLVGGLANLARYLFECADFTRPLDMLVQWAAHFSLTETLLGLYRVTILPIFGSLGAAEPFTLNWAPTETTAWFGPLAFFLVIPAVLYALVRGNRRLKATALALCGYVYLVCLAMAWRPGNAAYFTLFFACAGFLPAFFLAPWRFTDRGKRRLGALCLLLMAYVIVFNTSRPLVSPAALSLPPAGGVASPEGIWTRTDWGQDRLAPARMFFGDDRVDVFKKVIPAGSVVGLAGQDRALGYPYRLARTDLVFKTVPLAEIENRSAWEGAGLDFLVLVDIDPRVLPLDSGWVILWSAGPAAACPGALIKVR